MFLGLPEINLGVEMSVICQALNYFWIVATFEMIYGNLNPDTLQYFLCVKVIFALISELSKAHKKYS